jgi:hypothetical protein
MRSEDQSEKAPARGPARDVRTGRSAAAARIQHQQQWVDLQIREAEARGEFDDLPGKGKPIENLGAQHDPDWWVKRLVEREKITGVLPPALQLRKDDAELGGVLDKLATEREVRRDLEDFNRRVIEARRQLEGGPPVVTPTRDVDAEIAAWVERRRERVSRRTPDLSRQTGGFERSNRGFRRLRSVFRRG